MTPRTKEHRPLWEIAAEIETDWDNVSIHARAYLDPMHTLNKITDDFWLDSGKSVVLYFLSNAQSWKGETARRIKKELNDMAR